MCNRCNWNDHLEEIEGMIHEPEYDFAIDTIEGIYDWVFKNHHITEKQTEDIENIKNAR